MIEIPTKWYVDPKIFALEQETIFQNSPVYVGHELMVPSLNDYHVLHNKTATLIHNKNGIELLSNICRHHQAIMLEGRGKSEDIICPVHRWRYNNEGTLLNAPHFPENPCLNLESKRLKKWHGLLFSNQIDIEKHLQNIKLLSSLNFSHYAYSNTIVQPYRFNWKVFVDNYLDDYHVQPFHPGLRSLVDVNQVSWDFDDYHSVQKVGVQKDLLKSRSNNYRNWHQALLDYRKGVLPEYGAIWFLLYPATMIEHYPEMLTISTLVSDSPETCINIVDFFYPQEIINSYPDIVQLSQLSYNETALEDEEICDRIFTGRKSLASRDMHDVGPYDHPSEDGIPYFHQYLLSHLNGSITS